MRINVILIRRELADKGITHKGMGALMGLSQARFSQIMAKGNTSIARAEIIIKHLGLDRAQVLLSDECSKFDGVYHRLTMIEKKINVLEKVIKKKC